jgi:hypothetical protein
MEVVMVVVVMMIMMKQCRYAYFVTFCDEWYHMN